MWQLQMVFWCHFLHTPDHRLVARRVQCWPLASFVHSSTVILHTYKSSLVAKEMDNWKLLFICPGPLFVLIVSLVLLVILLKDYPIREDLLITSFIIGSGFVAYALIALTDIMYLVEMNITFEILLIPLTVCMHTLRFMSQGTSGQFEMIPFLVAFLGIFPGVLCFIPLRSWFLENILEHLPLKIATLVGAIFRFVDVIVICNNTAAEPANYFRSRLQECLL